MDVGGWKEKEIREAKMSRTRKTALGEYVVHTTKSAFLSSSSPPAAAAAASLLLDPFGERWARSRRRLCPHSTLLLSLSPSLAATASAPAPTPRRGEEGATTLRLLSQLVSLVNYSSSSLLAASSSSPSSDRRWLQTKAARRLSGDIGRG